MKYSELFTPIEAFSAFIIKNIETIVEKCNINEVVDFSMDFVRHPKSEDLCLMTLTHDNKSSLFICQLFNNDSFGFPETGINEAVKRLRQMPGTDIYLLCPGIYPQIATELAATNIPINLIVIDGNMCEYIPHCVDSMLPIGQKTTKKDEKV